MDLSQEFKQYLLAAHFKPGDHIPGELELAEKFHTSRAKIRAVLIHLTHLGILDRVKNRGTIICVAPQKKIQEELSFCFEIADYGYEDLKEARLYLELSIVPLILSRMTPAILKRLSANLTRQQEVVEKRLGGEVFDHYDMEFHLLLLEAAQNRSLEIFANILLMTFNRRYRTKFLHPDANAEALEKHRRILQTVCARDEALLFQLIRDHIAAT